MHPNQRLPGLNGDGRRSAAAESRCTKKTQDINHERITGQLLMKTSGDFQLVLGFAPYASGSLLSVRLSYYGHGRAQKASFCFHSFAGENSSVPGACGTSIYTHIKQGSASLKKITNREEAVTAVRINLYPTTFARKFSQALELQLASLASRWSSFLK